MASSSFEKCRFTAVDYLVDCDELMMVIREIAALQMRITSDELIVLVAVSFVSHMKL